ncbi:MAG: hypothetical protein PUP93_33895 [Rhizonema sp. NSF051]|nr:hypothetical protein [Rhizonema sp. NSF051]
MKRKLSWGLLGAIAALLNPMTASATSLSPHFYALGRTYSNVPIHGTYFVSQNTGEDLSNNNPTSGQIITKETWLNFSYGNGNEWIETGTLYGNIYRSFSDKTLDTAWRGSFVATNGCAGASGSTCSSYTTTFREGEVGANLTGTHNFIIRKKTDGSGDYQVYIDYNPTTVINGSSFTVSDPISADMGIESSDTGNSWTSGTIGYDWWIVDPSNETNPGTAGWYPVNPNIAITQITSNNYNGASVNFQYPYNNGTTVPAGAVTQSNRFLFNHN